MDVVSDAISAVRAGRPSSNRLRVSGSWSVRLAPYEGAGFHVVLSGTCRLVPDGGGEPVTLGTGDVVLLPHGAGHVLADRAAGAAEVRRAVPFEEVRDSDVRRPGPGPDVELLCGKYRLDRNRTHPLLAELPQVVHLPHRVGDHPELRTAVDLLARELDEARPGACLALPSLLDLLLIYLVRAWMARAETGAWPAVLNDPVTTAALRALHSDPAAPWTAGRLASQAGVSRATLARRFTSLVGRPPMTYLTWWRLTLAATRLRDSDAPLATVARETGYGSPYALSHAFSREFGTTPGRYREQARAARPAVTAS
ncbi:AraC family transcriptional regulator [Streptomyces cellostaticus]|uniref:AraC family transcriptional regulator n=1 Tax=Streptomyces cellostaticus TaxID=67285 RepID=A0A101NPA4_9ACTN|nr:AraC family transcriptional regulator [Streptomyces cellostaticus]KUM96679.1 AraC family transcriptional regulator [Streptomyces cellostaticus]GHI05538.1 AraC family transcriptional regulator [Streptomyces cellostaticus]